MMLCLLVMVPAMIPTTPFNVAAGYLFGWAGLPVLMVGAIGGAQLAFLLCRVSGASNMPNCESVLNKSCSSGLGTVRVRVTEVYVKTKYRMQCCASQLCFVIMAAMR